MVVTATVANLGSRACVSPTAGAEPQRGAGQSPARLTVTDPSDFGGQGRTSACSSLVRLFGVPSQDGTRASACLTYNILTSLLIATRHS